MKNGSKVLIYLTFSLFLKDLHNLISNAKRKMSKSNRSGLWNRFLLFLTFPMLAAKLSEMITRFQAHNLKIQHPTMTSMASIMVWPNILKIVSTKCKSSKYWWDVRILGRGRIKTKCPQQWGVNTQNWGHFGICNRQFETP